MSGENITAEIIEKQQTQHLEQTLHQEISEDEDNLIDLEAFDNDDDGMVEYTDFNTNVNKLMNDVNKQCEKKRALKLIENELNEKFYQYAGPIVQNSMNLNDTESNTIQQSKPLTLSISKIEPAENITENLEESLNKEGFTIDQWKLLLNKIVIKMRDNVLVSDSLKNILLHSKPQHIEVNVYDNSNDDDDDELYLSDILQVEKLSELFEFLEKTNSQTKLFLNVVNNNSVDILCEILFKTPEYIKFIKYIVCDNLDTIIYCQSQCAELLEKLMYEVQTNEWINMYNINFFLRTYFPDIEKLPIDKREKYTKNGYTFNYVNNSLDQFLKKHDLTDKFYEANNNMKFPGAICGLYVQYNTSFKSVSNENDNASDNTSDNDNTSHVKERSVFAKDLRAHLEKCTKKNAPMAMWNDSNLTPDMDTTENLEQNMDIWHYFDHINSEV